MLVVVFALVLLFVGLFVSVAEEQKSRSLKNSLYTCYFGVGVGGCWCCPGSWCSCWFCSRHFLSGQLYRWGFLPCQLFLLYGFFSSYDIASSSSSACDIRTEKVSCLPAHLFVFVCCFPVIQPHCPSINPLEWSSPSTPVHALSPSLPFQNAHWKQWSLFKEQPENTWFFLAF